MNKPALLTFTVFLLLCASGCMCPRGSAFDFDDPTSVVTHAWHYINRGYACDEGNFSRDQLKLSQIDYSSDGTSVEVSFYIVGSFKTDVDGGLTYKLLDIEMDKTGKFVSAATADGSQGVPSRVSF